MCLRLALHVHETVCAQIRTLRISCSMPTVGTCNKNLKTGISQLQDYCTLNVSFSKDTVHSCACSTTINFINTECSVTVRRSSRCEKVLQSQQYASEQVFPHYAPKRSHSAIPKCFQTFPFMPAIYSHLLFSDLNSKFMGFQMQKM